MKKLLLSALIIFGITTLANAQPVCGGTFTDPLGDAANYDNNTDYTVTITPVNPGDMVTVTFTAFATETNFDALYVFDGASTSSPQIASTNAAGFVPGGLAGGYWGNTIPGPFISSDASGALTFRFRSDGTVGLPGWIANVTCSPRPTCLRPTTLDVSSITYNSALLTWTEGNAATSWEVLAVPCGAPAPLDSTVGQTANTNPFLLTGLSPLTCYDYYVRSICSSTDKSTWNGPRTFTTLLAPPVCGGTFTDVAGPTTNYANNSDSTVTITPTNPGDVVTVTFTAFSTEATYDALYVFDGNSTSSPQIPSANPAGNTPGAIPGGYWGSVIPGPFTSTDASGALTFRFRSDGSVNNPGWIANVSCAPPPNCATPSALVGSNPTINSVDLAWTENGTATSWQLLVLPCGSPAPNGSTIGQSVISNPTTISGLTQGSCYEIYLRSVCPMGDYSAWSTRKTIYTTTSNDECVNAIVAPVNSTNSCAQTVAGTITGGTPSAAPVNETCVGTPDDDVWFQFVATSASLGCTLQNVTGNTNNLNFRVYSGSCSSLTSFYCSTANSLSGYLNDLVIGQTYFIQVYSNASTPQVANFNLCLNTPSTCTTSQSACGVNNYINTTNIPSLGTVGCLFTTPNATYFNLKIAQTGPVNLQLSQTDFNGIGRDVDYAAWGPFASNEAACTAIAAGQAPGIGVPLTLTTGCSYSTAATEYLNIANAIAGEYYIILVTNFSNQAGYINLFQNNTTAVGAGSIDCSGIRLNAFIDTNANGTQDSGEVNFPLGQFQYTSSASTNLHNITSPSGMYTIYDESSSNTYNLNYTINPELSAVYSTSASYSNVVVAAGGMTTYNFPITSLQNYNDVGVTLLPLSSPRAGFTYQDKIVYTNNGNQTIASGSLSFTKNANVTITDISQSGTITTATGFTYNYTNLLPFESRTIIVTMSVPPIPTVYLGQSLTNTADVTPVSGDLISNNNTSSLTQTVTGSYDPNDKSEAHGGKIVLSSFTSNDYLYYTIRFENTGTAGALNVRVTDMLDTQLNEDSIQMISASHSYTLDRVGGSLVWKFDNIQLPVSVPNTTTGKGYINFKIKPRAGYAVGDIIPNTASIYFDSNPAIVTNTYDTEFVQALGNQYYDFNNLFSLSPVPARHFLNITIKQDVVITSVNIYNTLGQLVQMVNNPNETIDVSGLQTGTYFIKILSDKGTASSKFLKE